MTWTRDRTWLEKSTGTFTRVVSVTEPHLGIEVAVRCNIEDHFCQVILGPIGYFHDIYRYLQGGGHHRIVSVVAPQSY